MRGRSGIGLPLFFALVLLTGCAPEILLPRPEIADRIAAKVNWVPSSIRTDGFLLRLYAPANPAPVPEVVVYLEGDGLAWIDRSSPSTDPTPRDPIGLRLAVSTPHKPAAYLARPCQYTIEQDATRCSQDVWTHGRYSEEVIAALSQGVSRIKALFRAERITLVGYSGGGTVAALLAARRDDVSLLVTVAANLDIDAWVRHHGVSPLFLSLNPSVFGDRLKKQRQVHFVGTDDEVVPPAVVQSYANKVDKSLLRTIRYVEDANHDCCWADKWPDLIRRALP